MVNWLDRQPMHFPLFPLEMRLSEDKWLASSPGDRDRRSDCVPACAKLHNGGNFFLSVVIRHPHWSTGDEKAETVTCLF